MKNQLGKFLGRSALIAAGALFYVAMPAIAVDLGKPAPDFELSSPRQESIKLSGYKGKVVYLDFWASWCVPCRETFPFMNQLREKFAKDGLEIVAVNIDTKRPDADKFLAQIPADFTILFDAKRAVAKTYELKGLPTTFLIDRDGNVISTHLGFQKDRAGELEAHIAKALADSPQK
jgi:cytochrome c biogenesis protein CcmG, thiol:disulfide interchange protein DsbE